MSGVFVESRGGGTDLKTDQWQMFRFVKNNLVLFWSSFSIDTSTDVAFFHVKTINLKNLVKNNWWD